MERWIKASGLVFLSLLVTFANADTFRHKESGELFTGFVTQKVTAGRTLVYNSDEGKMTPVVLSEYEVTPDGKGRQNTVSLALLGEPDIFLSEVVSKKAAETIIAASNKGPRAIILQIDGPGGRGSAMKTVADAVLQTENCPVIAYISKGAYSSAAVVALACDKVYIHPTAGIGAVGAFAEDLTGSKSYSEHLSVYNSDSLLSYENYVSALAQRHDFPELLARAFIDMRVSIVEVANTPGDHEFIESRNRQTTQTVIRTLCEGVTASITSENITPADVAGKVLNLTAKDAVEIGIADGIAGSLEEVQSALQVSEAKLIPAGGIEKTLKKYHAARRNILDGIYRIEQYEQDVQTLSEQFSTIDNQLRTGMQTRETSRGETGYSYNRRRQTQPWDYNYNERGYSYPDNRNRRTRNADRNRMPNSQTLTTEEPRVNIEIVYSQLTYTLRDLIAEYRRTLNIVKHWPGGLPYGVSEAKLQADMDSASSELDRLYRYQPIYPTQNQTQIPQRRNSNRRRY